MPIALSFAKRRISSTYDNQTCVLDLMSESMLPKLYLLILTTCLLSPGWLWAEDDKRESRDESTELTAAEPTAKKPLFVTPASLQRRPVWEFGVGGGYFSGFDYPASKDVNQRFLALPFFIYRSPRFRLGDGGVRAIAIERPRLKLDLAVAASLNASSEGNSVREGMEDLDFLFEIGPQLELSLFDRAMPSGGRVQMRLNAELRAVMETDFHKINSRGLVAELGLGLSFRNVKHSGMDLLTGISTSYGNERLQDYFYEVDPEFATDTRPEFDAKGGYLESRVFGGLGFRARRNVRIFMGVFTGLYDGVRNQESPLFETTSSTGFALGVVWTIKSSRQMVDIVDMGSSQ
jgi:hypothetical protein